MSDFEDGAEMVRDLSLADETSLREEPEKKGKSCTFCGQLFKSSDDNPFCPDCREI